MSTIAHAQARPPQLLVEATQCLEAKDNFPSQGTKSLMMGYMLDDKSYPGQTVLYVVNYINSSGSKGFVFTIFLTAQNGVRLFNIQNNATFTYLGDSADGVSFDNPPLGGTWTQEHLISAIERIEKEGRFIVPIESGLPPSPSIQCESYTDQ